MALLLLTPFQEARSAAPAALLCRNYLLKDRGQVEVVQYRCWRSRSCSCIGRMNAVQAFRRCRRRSVTRSQ